EFEQLKARLDAEGLFDPARKRALPRYARRIGVVTSATGAAIRDVLSVLARRWPLADVEILPVPVQGREAPPAIVAMLRKASASARYDVLLLTRGGGSLEDLWAFNDEAVARAIHASAVPVVSAVGHEIDFSIADFVADLRAPTPSAAAELLVPDAVAVDRHLRQLQQRLATLQQRRMQGNAQRVDHLLARLRAAGPSPPSPPRGNARTAATPPVAARPRPVPLARATPAAAVTPAAPSPRRTHPAPAPRHRASSGTRPPHPAASRPRSAYGQPIGHAGTRLRHSVRRGRQGAALDAGRRGWHGAARTTGG